MQGFGFRGSDLRGFTNQFMKGYKIHHGLRLGYGVLGLGILQEKSFDSKLSGNEVYCKNVFFITYKDHAV